MQQMLDRSAATATTGRVLLRLDYTLTRILCVYVCVFCTAICTRTNAARARNAQCIYGRDVAVVVLCIYIYKYSGVLHSCMLNSSCILCTHFPRRRPSIPPLAAMHARGCTHACLLTRPHHGTHKALSVEFQY